MAKSSNFLLTINPNRDDETYINLLKEAYVKFYDKIEDFVKYNKKQPEPDKLNHIKSLNHAVEKGGKFNRYHLQCLIQFTHDTNIHLDKAKIKKFFSTELGCSVYCDITYIKDGVFMATRYLDKDKH